MKDVERMNEWKRGVRRTHFEQAVNAPDGEGRYSFLYCCSEGG